MNEFIDWINHFIDELGLEYSIFDWTQELPIDLYDIQCTFRSNGKTLTGRGTDVDRDSAIVKATAECLERYFLARLTEADSSNGVAIHTERHAAELSALFELLERDSFFCHFLTKTPFATIDKSNIRKSGVCGSIISLLESKGAEIRFGQMRTDSRFSSVVCAIFGNNSSNGFGMTLGTSVKRNMEESIFSALLESARSAAGYLCLTSGELFALRSNCPKVCSTPEHHLLVGLESAYAERFKNTFFDNQMVSCENSQLDLQNVEISSFKPLLDESSAHINPPLSLSRASSTELLSLYFGDFIADQRKIMRLERFIGRHLSPEDLNQEVHPFG